MCNIHEVANSALFEPILYRIYLGTDEVAMNVDVYSFSMLFNYNWWVYRCATPKYQYGCKESKPTAKALFMPRNERLSTSKETPMDNKPGYVAINVL